MNDLFQQIARATCPYTEEFQQQWLKARTVAISLKPGEVKTVEGTPFQAENSKVFGPLLRWTDDKIVPVYSEGKIGEYNYKRLKV